MRSFLPSASTVVEVKIQKTPEFYELYHIDGNVHHSFLATENDTLNTVLVTEPFGKEANYFSVNELWKEGLADIVKL